MHILQKKNKSPAANAANAGKKKHLDKTVLIAAVLLITGWYVFTFPLINDLLNRIYNLNTINGYGQYTNELSQDEITDRLQKTREYDDQIFARQQEVPFRYQGQNVTDNTYESLPTGNTQIGTLYIPKIGVEVAVGHGTKDTMLQGEAGHLYGTSIPAEGENVHAVIAGHSALATAKLFTDLNKLDKGDQFSITVLNQKYTYTVDQITVCLPTDEAQYEQIVPGRNYVTLYTCAPYGINTHRLLVRGELTNTEAVSTGTDFANSYIGSIVKNSLMLSLILLTPLLAVVIQHVYTDLRRKHKRKNGRKGDTTHEENI